jgi:hypothetical protein
MIIIVTLTSNLVVSDLATKFQSLSACNILLYQRKFYETECKAKEERRTHGTSED